LPDQSLSVIHSSSPTEVSPEPLSQKGGEPSAATNLSPAEGSTHQGAQEVPLTAIAGVCVYVEHISIYMYSVHECGEQCCRWCSNSILFDEKFRGATHNAVFDGMSTSHNLRKYLSTL